LKIKISKSNFSFSAYKLIYELEKRGEGAILPLKILNINESLVPLNVLVANLAFEKQNSNSK